MNIATFVLADTCPGVALYAVKRRRSMRENADLEAGGGCSLGGQGRTFDPGGPRLALVETRQTEAERGSKRERESSLDLTEEKPKSGVVRWDCHWGQREQKEHSLAHGLEHGHRQTDMCARAHSRLSQTDVFCFCKLAQSIPFRKTDNHPEPVSNISTWKYTLFLSPFVACLFGMDMIGLPKVYEYLEFTAIHTCRAPQT